MKRAVLCLLLICSLALFALPAVAQDDMAQPLVGAWEACETPSGLPETINIGAIFALSEAAAVYGSVQKQAVELAVEEINASGYLGEGTTLAVIFEDSAGDRDQAIAAMTKLVEEDGVPLVIGPTLSSEATAAVPVGTEAGVVVLGVSNTASGLKELLGEYWFRDSLPESAVIPGTIAQATELLGLESVGVLYGNDDDFTVSGYEVFVSSLEESGVEITGEETFAKGDVDFNAQLTNLIGTEPDALVVSALAAEAVQIIIQARAQGYEGPIIGGNGFNSPAVLNQAGEDAEGLIVGGAWNYSNPEPSDSSVAFVEAYEAMFEGASPDQFAAQAYTGAWLAATAIRCAGSAESADLQAAFGTIADFESPLGTFAFDEAGEPLHPPVAQIVVEGEFVPLAVAMEAEN